MFNSFNPNLGNSLSKNILRSGWRAWRFPVIALQDPGLHQGSLYGYKGQCQSCGTRLPVSSPSHPPSSHTTYSRNRDGLIKTKISRRTSLPIHVIPITIPSKPEAMIAGIIVKGWMDSMKSAKNQVVSATEGLDGVLMGKI